MALEDVLKDMQRQISELQDQVTGLRKIERAGIWSQYNPTWTASSSNPSWGNTDLSRCLYTTIGKIVIFELFIIFGSTATFGTGYWTFTMPIPAKNQFTSKVTLYDDNLGKWFTLGGIRCAGANFNIYYPTAFTGGDSTLSNSIPFTWAQSDRILASGTYVRN